MMHGAVYNFVMDAGLTERVAEPEELAAVARSDIRHVGHEACLACGSKPTSFGSLGGRPQMINKG